MEPEQKRLRTNDDDVVEENASEELAVQDEHRVWQKNSPFLYDAVVCQTLDWPSLTIQWLPGVREDETTGNAFCKIVIGTHTNREETDYIKVVEVRLPRVCAGLPPCSSASSAGESDSVPGDRVRVVQMVPHDGEVNRLRCMPQNPNIVATLAPADDDDLAQAFVFNLASHPAFPPDDEMSPTPRPNVRLSGLREEGYGLSWSPSHEGILASGCNDGTIVIWDVNSKGSVSAASESCAVGARDTVHHGSVVEDVAWCPSNSNLLASVGDDGALKLWDVRALQSAVSVHNKRHGTHECNSVAWAPGAGHLYATGGGDGVVSLWDMRRPEFTLHALEHHTGAVFEVAWSPLCETLLASSATDRRIMIWDVTKIGDEQSADDAKDGPPELVFIHSGHTSGIAEFALSPASPWTVASVDNDNALQIWQPAENVRTPEDFSKPISIPASQLE